MSAIDFWKQMDERAAKAKAEVDATKSIIEEIKTRGSKWRFIGVKNGVLWVARHRLFDEIREQTAEQLVAHVQRIHDRETKTVPT